MAARAPVRTGTKVHTPGDDRARHRQQDRREALCAIPAREARATTGLSVATATSSPLERLKRILGEVADLKHAEAVLDWDSRVSMPPAGAEARAEVSATLTRNSHERFVADDVGELLGELDGLDTDPDSDEAALIRVTHRLWERTRRVP